MHRDDLVSHVRIRARLRGRGHARNVIGAVVGALHGLVPEPAFQALTAQLPPGIDVQRPAGDAEDAGACRRLIRRVERRLHVDSADAAFYARVTFEQLNAFCRGTTPAALAASLPADLRPLLSARTEDPALRYRNLLRTAGAAVATLSLAAATVPAPSAAPAATITANGRSRGRRTTPAPG